MGTQNRVGEQPLQLAERELQLADHHDDLGEVGAARRRRQRVTSELG